jgi:flagellar hook-associated protein 1 FlgK
MFAALTTTGNSLDVLERAISVVQNNVSNSATPGYVTQSLQLNASRFDPSQGVWGGVEAGNVESARNTFAEQSVWSANQQVGSATQQTTSLQSLNSLFNVSGTSGIPGALSTLYSAFSAWSTSPTSTTAQQQVLNAATGVAQAFNSVASGVASVRSSAVTQTKSAVTQINQLSSQIATLNGEIRNGGQNDSGLQAQLYNNLEQLSNYANISVQPASDGTVSVLMEGQVPLVIGQTSMALQETNTNPSSSTSNAAPDQQILASDGRDVTSLIQGGQLGGLLQVTNSVIPSLIGDGTQQGSLNLLAQKVADTVNGLLATGQTGASQTATPLFTYTGGSPTTVAGSLGVTSNFSTTQLVAADPGPPAVANGIASQLAQLQNPTAAADMINGSSYSDYYSSVAANVGTLESTASQTQTAQTAALTQAQSTRSQLSGVSLNDQAAILLQFQEAYQASSQALSTIHSTLQYFMQSMQSVT